jgi:hypothetical protein
MQEVQVRQSRVLGRLQGGIEVLGRHR